MAGRPFPGHYGKTERGEIEPPEPSARGKPGHRQLPAGNHAGLHRGSLHRGGIPVRLTDTAGIREGRDEVEEEGVRRVWEKTAEADGVIVLLDGSVALSPEDELIMEKHAGRKILVAVNKSDLPQKLDDGVLRTLVPGADPLRISAKYGDGMADLKEAIRRMASLDDRGDIADDGIVTNRRHRDVLERTRASLKRGKEAFLEGRPPELLALDLREALSALGEITGETATEEVLDIIFSRFCIGK